MFGWRKKKVKEVGEIEKKIVAYCIEEIKSSFLELNGQLVRMTNSVVEIKKSVGMNHNAIVGVSQGLTTLAQFINALTARVEQLEGHLSLSSVKFEKDKNN
ncbi:hypothetical protein LCGC14_2004190 [marine sediment metagenome]|uniref:Uncharacterized protein n=1 Tax=marine sediment metagenome TaxID=412755 RepID=A0A0F9HFP1_9ZZZZ